ncbi:MAG: hypothetical protein KGI33_08830 [Thaumarchaeota archaeon]|nr:hypothetical protein [Nitrososphaerota archaeon]
MNNLQVLTTSQISDTFVPSPILDIYYQLEKDHKNRLDWINASEEHLWRELCFCILSGNVAYELAKSVVDVLTERGYLDYKWMMEDNKSRITLFHELDKPNFDPRKKNGELRKYRYPKKRSAEIVGAAKALYRGNSIKSVLSNMTSDLEARNFFVNQISGLGIKEASHFLRNIGFTNSLAIIDVHVLTFLKEFSLVDFDTNSSLTLQRYLRLEKTLRNFAEYHGFNLALFDLAVWHYMRNKEL